MAYYTLADLILEIILVTLSLTGVGVIAQAVVDEQLEREASNTRRSRTNY